MPRKRVTPEQRQQAEWDAADKRLVSAIYGWLGVTGHSVGELGEMILCSKSTMYKRLHKPGSFELDELRRLRTIIPEVDV